MKGQDFVSPSATRSPAVTGARVEQTGFVTVLGDTLAILTAQGLTDAFANRPDISVTNAARDLSGLYAERLFRLA